MNNEGPTLCWDCANATGGCSWSAKLKPVKGWKALPTHKVEFDSWMVVECPEFVRDALMFGQKRMNRKDEEDEQIDDHWEFDERP